MSEETVYCSCGQNVPKEIVNAVLAKRGAATTPPDFHEQPCPDLQCNDKLGAAPIPQCVTAVFWGEEAMALGKIAEAARDFVWEPENWEAYLDSKNSNSVAWPPEFLLLAQAVEEKYGPMPIDEEDK